MKYGKVLTYKDTEEAQKLIGKRVVYRDAIASIEKWPESLDVGILQSFDCGVCYPFYVDGGHFQFIREVIEGSKPELMTNLQLAEWCSRRLGQCKILYYIRTDYVYPEGADNELIDDNTVIRPWESEEWIIPTVDIYKRDCRNEQ